MLQRMTLSYRCTGERKDNSLNAANKRKPQGQSYCFSEQHSAQTCEVFRKRCSLFAGSHSSQGSSMRMTICIWKRTSSFLTSRLRSAFSGRINCLSLITCHCHSQVQYLDDLAARLLNPNQSLGY